MDELQYLQAPNFRRTVFPGGGTESSLAASAGSTVSALGFIGNATISKRHHKESMQYEGLGTLGGGISGGGGIGNDEDRDVLRASCSLTDVQVRLSYFQ